MQAWERSIARYQKRLEDMASLDFSNQGFVNWLTDTSLSVFDAALGEAAKDISL